MDRLTRNTRFKSETWTNINIFDKLTGNTQGFIGGVQQLVSGLSLEALIEAKSRGAKFD